MMLVQTCIIQLLYFSYAVLAPTLCVDQFGPQEEQKVNENDNFLQDCPSINQTRGQISEICLPMMWKFIFEGDSNCQNILLQERLLKSNCQNQSV